MSSRQTAYSKYRSFIDVTEGKNELLRWGAEERPRKSPRSYPCSVFSGDPSFCFFPSSCCFSSGPH